MILMWYNTQTYFRKIILRKWWSQRQFIFNFSRDVCWIVNFKIWHSCAEASWEVLPPMIVSHITIGISRDRVKTLLWSSNEDHGLHAVIQAIIQSQQSSSKLRKITSGLAIRGSLARNQSSFHTDQQTFQELSLLNFLITTYKNRFYEVISLRIFHFLVNNRDRMKCKKVKFAI